MSDKQAPYKMTGKVVLVKDEEHISDKFSKRTIVVDLNVNGKYSNPVPVDYGNDAIEKIADACAGQEVEVRFYLNGFQGRKDPAYYGVGCKGVDFAILTDVERQADEDPNLPF